MAGSCPGTNRRLPIKKGGCMILFGESLNVISTKIGKAFKERDPKPIQEEALFQKEKGMDYIDINLGPAKKDGHELMPWVVEVVQEVVDDIPLLLDTSNIDAIAAALKKCKLTPIVNSILKHSLKLHQTDSLRLLNVYRSYNTVHPDLLVGDTGFVGSIKKFDAKGGAFILIPRQPFRTP